MKRIIPMKFKAFMICMVIIFLAEIFVLVRYSISDDDFLQSAVEVNEALQSIRDDWENISAHQNVTSLNYAVLDSRGNVIFRTRQSLSESLNEAVIHRDTILDIEINGETAGKIIIYNDSPQTLWDGRKRSAAILIFAASLQLGCFVIYSVYLYRRVVKPFGKLKNFAERVAGGNFDIPLEMDRGNIFGAFTESFDIMRSELKKARFAEARANSEKKELTAKLSHDIRTPVASIKAASEVGAAIAENEKSRQNYNHIIHKADQINTLVTNLFSATLEELQQLTVEPTDMESRVLTEMLSGADYFHYAKIPPVPDCMLFADKLRLQQVFDNIFANSYKYANTEITVEIFLDNNFLQIIIKDFGGGVQNEEISLLKEKFKRGKNAENVEGAGLGLYISDCFMKEMKGSLDVENDTHGLAVTVKILLSGTI